MDSESEADIRRVLRSSLGAVEETARSDPYMLQDYDEPSLSASEVYSK